jgi:hypothetical protein
MSFFTKVRDFVTAPVKAAVKLDPILTKLTTGTFSLNYKSHVTAAVHELYIADPIAKKLGIKETSIAKVAIIAGYVVAAYFTVFTLGLGAGLLGSGGTASAVSQGISAAVALNDMAQKKKAADEAASQQAAAAAQAAEAEKQAKIAEQLAVQTKPATMNAGAVISLLAIAAALLS